MVVNPDVTVTAVPDNVTTAPEVRTRVCDVSTVREPEFVRVRVGVSVGILDAIKQ